MRTPKPVLTASLTALLATPVLAADPVEVFLVSREGEQIGTANLTKVKDGVQISVQAQGLSNGGHGLHIHDRGACEPPAFESAGSHYQPDGSSHGFLDPEGPHSGDLPMLTPQANGEVTDYQFTTDLVALDETSLLKPGGTSLVVHARADDYLTGTGGGTGDRIACGVISAAGGTGSR